MILWLAVLTGIILTGFDILFFARTGRGIGILLAGVFLALLLVQGFPLICGEEYLTEGGNDGIFA